MKRKTKAERGITLVALIITIVLLLILASVAISSMQGDGILKYATIASGSWNESVGNEVNTIGRYENFIDKYLNGTGENTSGGNTGGNTEETTPGNNTKGREGQKVKYDSNNDGIKEDWIILTDRDGLVEIVSAAPMGNLTLGWADTTVNVTEDLDGDGKVGNAGDKAIASYNNAITTINNYCKSLVTAKDNEGVRSVGRSSDTSGNYSSTNFNKWFKNSSTVKVKAGDPTYETDYARMRELGIAGTGEEYWIPSRYVSELSYCMFFSVLVVYGDTGGWHTDNLWRLDQDMSVLGYEGEPCNYGVRPVVINPSGI